MCAYCGFPEVIPALFYFVPLTLFNVCECTDRSILKSQGRTIARYVFVGNLCVCWPYKWNLLLYFCIELIWILLINLYGIPL
jgi:hypothetical protein